MIIETPFIGITFNGRYTMTFGLQVWETTGEPPVKDGDPVIDTQMSVPVKSDIAGKTPDQLVNRGLQQLGPKMQDEIDNYNKCKQALAAVDFAAKALALAGGLNG